MTKENDVNIIRTMCELKLTRAAESGKIMHFEDLYQHVKQECASLPSDEGLLLTDKEIEMIVGESLEEFENTIFRLEENDDYYY